MTPVPPPSRGEAIQPASVFITHCMTQVLGDFVRLTFYEEYLIGEEHIRFIRASVTMPFGQFITLQESHAGLVKQLAPNMVRRDN